jgi:hypothetical protein
MGGQSLDGFLQVCLCYSPSRQRCPVLCRIKYASVEVPGVIACFVRAQVRSAVLTFLPVCVRPASSVAADLFGCRASSMRLRGCKWSPFSWG